MNHAKLGRLPDHITHVRQGATIWTRYGNADWNPMGSFPSKGEAKRYVRLVLGCKGGPRSAVRTAESLDLE